MSIQTFVTISFKTMGFHRWEDAPHSVAFLQHEHRHIFGVRVKAKTTHNNRQIEFFDLQERACQAFEHVLPDQLSRLGPHYGNRSCEMLAEQLLNCLRTSNIDVVFVSVSEDDENVGTAEFTE